MHYAPISWQNALEKKSATAAGAVNKVAICDKSGKYCVDVFPAQEIWLVRTG